MTTINEKKIDTNIVAFDFFDTIVHRDCDPETILFQWAKEISLYLNFSVTPSSIYKARKKVEYDTKKQGLEEVPYDNLLRELFKELNRLADSPIIATIEEFLTFAKELETKIEIEHIYLDNDTVEFIGQAYENGKLLYIISDFYADSSLLNQVLIHFGIRKYFKDIFVSSEYNARKSTGKLYEVFLSRLNVAPESVTMIGDNYKSDVINPMNLGLASYFKEYKHVTGSIVDKKELKNLYRKTLYFNAEIAPFNGFIADILYFISKLHVQLVKDGVKQILFCSREGQLLKTLFDQYQNSYFHENKINTDYFYVSRRSTLYPSLEKLERESFDIIFRQYKRISLENFLLNLNFSRDEISNISSDLQVDMTHKIDRNSVVLEKLKSNPCFIKRYKLEKAKDSNFRNYVTSLTQDDSIYIVDIGWKGTIQDNIQKALPDKKVVGYYFGLKYNGYQSISKNNKFGIMFNDFPHKTPFFDIISRNYEIYEDIFVADHGPVVAYDNVNGKILPILDEHFKHVKVFEKVNDFQQKLIEGIDILLDAYTRTDSLPYELYDLFLVNSLKKECVFVPKLYNLRNSLREEVVENFGEVVVKEKVRFSRKRLLAAKKDLLWVDFSYQLFDKVPFLTILPKTYCTIVFGIRRLVLKLKDGI